MKPAKAMRFIKSVDLQSAQDKIQEREAEIHHLLSEQLKEFEPEIKSAKNFVKKNPLLSLGGALLFGFFLGKIWSRRKTSGSGVDPRS